MIKERKERKIRSHFQRDKTPVSEYDSDDDAPLAKCKSTRQSFKFRAKSEERKIRSHSQRDKTIVSEYTCTSDDSDDDDSLAQTAKVARRKPPVKLRTYDGTKSWETFFAHFQSCAKYNNWTYKDKLAQLEAALIGDAGQVLWDSGQVGSISLSELINLLKAHFSGSRLAAKHRAELRSRRRRPGETVFSLHQDICRMLALAEPELPREARDRIGIDSFIVALNDPDLELRMRERELKTLSDALTAATTLEGWLIEMRAQTAKSETYSQFAAESEGKAVSNSGNPLRPSRVKVRYTGSAPAKTGQPPMTQCMDTLEANVNKVMERFGELSSTAKTAIVQTSANARNFASQSNAQGGRINAPVGQARAKTITCYTCGGVGRMSRQCPSHTPTSASQTQTANIQANFAAATDEDINLATPITRVSKALDRDNVYIKMHLYGKTIPCLLDSGCAMTLVPESLLHGAKDISLLPFKQRVWAANALRSS